MTFSWASSTTGATYDLKIASDSGCTTLVNTYSGIATTSKTVSDIAVGSYYACVTASSGGVSRNASNNGYAFDTWHYYGNPATQNITGGHMNMSLASDLYFFQPNNTAITANRGGGATVAQNGVSTPYGISVWADPNSTPIPNRMKLIVTDRFNNRLLIYNKIPRTSDALPDVVVGQSGFSGGTANAGGSTSAAGLNGPSKAAVCPDGRLMVPDISNKRVLVWNQIPTANGVSANYAIGQPDLATGTAGTTASKFQAPYAVQCTSDYLVVSDRNNSRILIYTATGGHSLPSQSTPNPTPAVVLGQSDLISAINACSGLRRFDHSKV